MTIKDFGDFKIRPSKHFILGWMRKWGWDLEDIREGIKNNYKIEKCGKCKYEVYIKDKGKSKKIIFIVDEEYKEILRPEG